MTESAASTRSVLIGRRIARAREAAHLTQAELAALIPGKSDGTQVSKWERGIHRPSDDTLEHIAAALDRPVSHFLADDKPAQPASNTAPDLFERRAGDAEVLSRLDALAASQEALATQFSVLQATQVQLALQVSRALVQLQTPALRAPGQLDQGREDGHE